MNEMDIILWSVYITEYNVFSEGTTTRCYNFRGTKKDLMCLIGVIHSINIVQCRVSYFPNRKNVPMYDENISFHISNTGKMHLEYQKEVLHEQI